MGNWIQSLLSQFSEQTVRFAPQFVVGVVILLAFLAVGRIVRIIVVHAFERARLDQNLITLISGIIHVSTYIFAVVTALGTMGVNIGALIAGVGLSGFAISFALKDGLANLVAGISILLYRPFRIGDYISVTGLEGKVIRIDLRYTILKAKEATVLIPNSNLFTNSILVFNSKGELQTQNRIKNA
jgi:small conductance mechanosensitive channel